MASLLNEYRRLVAPLALLGLAVLSLLPAKWCGYGPPLGNAVGVLLRPLSMPLLKISSQLRHRSEHPTLGDAENLSDELRERDTMILALQRRVRDLELLTSQMQGLQR